jgi:hypothetical protein
MSICTEALARARNVLGAEGPHVRAVVPQILLGAHDVVATEHVALGLVSEDAYGLMWLKLPQVLVEKLGQVDGARIVRPHRSRIRYVVINGVPVVAWRYGKRSTTDIDRAVFGVSDTRRSLFRGQESHPELDFDWGRGRFGEKVLDELTDEDRAEVAALCADIRSLSEDGRMIAVLAYASSPAGVHRAYFGYAELSEDGALDWLYRENIDTSARIPGVAGVPAPRTPQSDTETFDSGPIATPTLRPRRNQKPTAP